MLQQNSGPSPSQAHTACPHPRLIERLVRSLSIVRQEPWLSCQQIRAPLLRQQFAINPDVSDQHLQALLKCLAHDSPSLHIRLVAESQAIRQRPCVTLSRHRAELVDYGEPFFRRSNNGGKQFSRKFPPEM